MRKSVFIILLLGAVLISSGQERKFGILNPSDLRIEECNFEKDAPAVVLFDKGNFWFIQDDNGFKLKFDRHVRIKIFDESAFDKGEFEIELYKGKNDRERVEDIEGVTCNVEDGRIVKSALTKDNIFKEDINEYWYAKKFAMPKVKEGSIIDVKYSITSPYYTHFRDWEFQTDIPVIYSEYKVNMIPFYSYRFRLQGAGKLDHYKKYKRQGLDRSFAGIKFNDMVYEFGLNNVPSFKDETYISSRNDYIKKIDFQMAEINYPSGYSRKYMESWPAMAKELLDHEEFGKYLKKAQKWGAKEFGHLIGKSEKERLDEIVSYMKLNYKWNRFYGKYAQRSIKEFNNTFTGNVGNINLSTIGALNSVGLNAKPIIISTRDNGKVTDSFPYSNLFNYVLILVEVDGKLRLADATEDMCPEKLIPARCINGRGFVVEEDSENWINIANKVASLEEFNLTINVDTDDLQINGNCTAKSTGYIALNERQNFHKDKEAFTKEISDKGITIENDLTVTNLFESEKPFLYQFDFTQGVDQIDNQLIISPFANLTQKDNPFKQENRSLPIDLIYLRGNRLIANIEIPDGYKVEELPISKRMNSENVAFTYSAHITDGKVQIVTTYQFKKHTYSAKSYKELKNFMNVVTSKVNSKIVFIKDDDLTTL